MEEELYFVDSEDLQHLKDSIKRKTYNENDISMHFPGKAYKDVLIRHTETFYPEETAISDEEVTYQMLVNEGYSEEMIEELEAEYGIKLERPKALFQIKSNSLTSGDSNEENFGEEILTPENPNPDDPISEDEPTTIEGIESYYVSSVRTDTYNYVDEIAKIEKWPYAGTDMAMMGFKSVTDEGIRGNVDLESLTHIIRQANATRQVTFLYTKNNPVFPDWPRVSVSNISPYLKILIAPETTTIWADFQYLNMSLIDLPKVQFVGENAFGASTYNLSDPKIPTVDKLFLSGCTAIGHNAFYGMTINQIEVPLVNSISSYAFYAVKGLSSITLPEVTIIPEDCFAYAYDLQTITLPKCQEIERFAFTFCSSLKSIYLGASTVASINCNDQDIGIFTQCTIYVPSTLLSNYQETYASFPFSSKFQSIEGDIL